MIKAGLTLLVIATLLVASGCGNRIWEDSKKGAVDSYEYVFDDAPTARSYHDTAEIPIIELNYRAADVLYSNVSPGELTLQSAIFVKRFINQNDPSDTTMFSHVMTQQVADRLVQREVLITDGKPNETDFKYGEGVTGADYLNRSALAAKDLPPRAAKLTGTYVIGDNFIYMSAKVTRLVDSAVVSAHNWTLPITDNVRQMLPILQNDDGLKPTVKTSF